MDDLIEDRIRSALDRARVLDSDKTVAGFFLAIAAYIFYEAGSYPDVAGQFPQMIAAVTIVGCALIIVGEYLPRPLQNVITDDGDVFGTAELEEEHDESTESDYDPVDSTVTSLTIIGYVVLILFVGFLVATPLFVVAYGLWKDLSRKTIGALAAGTTGAVFLLGDTLNISVEYAIMMLDYAVIGL